MGDASVLVALLGVMVMSFGLSWQGEFINFIGAACLMVSAPFNVKDCGEQCGVRGKVDRIGFRTTVVITPDELTHYIPNGKITGGRITNYSQREGWQIALHLRLPPNTSTKLVKEYMATLKKRLDELQELLHSKPKTVLISKLGELFTEVTIE